MTAFEYEDEDGDRITVRTDQELKTMIGFHSSYGKGTEGLFVHGDRSISLSSNGCLVIYPKMTKPSTRRNIHGLKVAIAPTASSLLLTDHSHVSQQLGNTLSQPSSESHSFQNSSCASVVDQQHAYDLQSYSRTKDRDHPTTSSVVPTNSPNADIKNFQDSLNFQLGKLSNDTLLFMETLGNGNSGIVRKAIHKQSQVITAVKAITLDLTGEEQKRILQELQILKKYVFLIFIANGSIISI